VNDESDEDYKVGYQSPPGLECWVSEKKSLVAVWPPGTK
jgi:hypothetical protein